MADPPLGLLDRLYIFNEDGRRTKINKYWESGLLDTSGFTLYKFHLVSTIKEEQRALHPSAVSAHYAEIRAGLRWSLLTDEQQEYWRRCTLALFDGCLWPVKDQTLESFAAGALDVLPADDDDDSDDDGSDFGSYTTRHIHAMEGDSSRPTTSGDDVDSNKAETLRTDGAEASTTSYGGLKARTCPPEHVAEDETVEAESQYSENGIAVFKASPTHDDLEPCNTSSCVPEGPRTDCIDLAQSQEEFSAEGRLQCWASQAPADKELLTPSAIGDLVKELREMAPGLDRDEKFEELNQAICTSGITLFLHHALAFRPATKKGVLKEETDWDDLWRSMPSNQRKLWRNDTVALKGCLAQRSLDFFNIFRVDEQSKRSRKYKLWVQENFDLYHTRRVKEAASDISKQKGNVKLTTIVDVLYGGPSFGASDQDLISKLLHSIRLRLNRRPDAVTRVRCMGIRINYDPAASDVSAIRSRLRNALSKADGNDFPSSRRQQEFENLLRPLAYFNRDSLTFADLPFKSGDINQYHRYYVYCLSWAKNIIKKVKPLEATKKHETVRRLLQGLRERVYGEDGQKHMSPLLEGGAEYDISSDDQGFVLKLLGCFEREDLTPAVYEDLLEQQMFRLFYRQPDIAKKCGVASPPSCGEGRRRKQQ